MTRPSTCDHIVSMWKVCLFAYNMTVILYTLWFSMVTVFICSNHGLCLNNFIFYMMGKKFICCLYCLLYLFCAIVLKVVKLQVISSCSEQNIFILVDIMFQLISVGLSRLIDRSFTNLLYIHITETRTEGIKSSYDEEFRIFKLKLA